LIDNIGISIPLFELGGFPLGLSHENVPIESVLPHDHFCGRVFDSQVVCGLEDGEAVVLNQINEFEPFLHYKSRT